MEKIKPLDNSRPSEKVIEEKINEFFKWKKTLTLGEYERTVTRFRGIMEGKGDKVAINEVYKNWTKDDFEKVLAGIDSDKESESTDERNEIKKALDRAEKNSDVQQIGLLKRVVNQLSEAVERMQKQIWRK